MEDLVQPMAINEATGEDDANMGNISSTSDDSMKAKATKKRKELFQINTVGDGSSFPFHSFFHFLRC